ncbi:hypothetical protein MJT46_015008 [Ovis ammon polii x Ovis aries]|nr:hypothetical protein MJT46_015008 [Ovis ammon polii x Ovis aries]
MENYEQQWREVAQLQGRVMKLQRCSRSYGAETETLQKQLGLEKEIQMKLQDEEALPDFQETLAEELRMSIRRIISDPVFFMEREQLGAIEEAVPAEERITEEAELVSEEAEAWEDLELEADEATQMNMVTSALEASGLGPSHLDIKYVLQQLAD